MVERGQGLTYAKPGKCSSTCEQHPSTRDFFFKFCLHLKLITVSICYINYARENMTHIYFQNVADEMRHLTWQDEVLTEG